MLRKLYLETRLYNVNDRLASLNLCDKIDGWIEEGLLADMEPCFLPYRDNPIPEGATDVPQAIFDMDIEELRSCSGVVGYFDGAHYDSGCGFEIGCGWAWGYPVNLITTDFYKWSVGDDHEHYYFGSKLMEHVADLVAVPYQDMAISDYRARSVDQVERGFAGMKERLVRDFGAVKEPVPLQALPVEYDYYLDPNFKYTESGQNLLAGIQAAIEGAGKSFVVGDNQGDIEADLENLRKSAYAVFFADPFEPHVDSSLLQGITYGIGRKPVLYTSNRQKYNAGELAGCAGKNVMISRSAAKVVSSLAELEAFIAG